MRAALLTGLRKFEIRTVPDPALSGDTDVLVRIARVGVCGSDIHYYTTGRIGTQIVRFPFVAGHEAAGIVERVGPGVTHLTPGQRVALEPAVSCGACDQCKANREHTCRHLKFLGAPGQLAGALSELVVLPERNCYPIPDTMTMDQAVLAEPLAIAVYAVEQSRVHSRANVAILGAGPIGMSVFHVLRARGIGRVYVTEKIDRRLDSARGLAPAWAGNPGREDIVLAITAAEPLLLDFVYECTGDPEAIDQGIRLLKPGGSLIVIGIPEVDEITLPIHELRRNEITIVNIRRQNHCTRKAIDLLASGTIVMDTLVTHHFPLPEADAAFSLVAGQGDGVMKAMIVLDGPDAHDQ